MLHKLNEEYIVKFLVRNAVGQRVTIASPICQIIKDDTKQYWNGVGWQSSPVGMSMSHFDSGVYVYSFTPTEKGTYTINCDEIMFSLHDMISLNVYSDEDVGLCAIKGEVFTFKFLALDITSGKRLLDANPVIKITDDSNGQCWSGNSWSDTSVLLAMTNFGEGIYTYGFTPNASGSFTVNISEHRYNLQEAYSLKVIDSPSTTDGSPVLVSSENLVGPDGSSAYVTDKDLVPMLGALVSAYDLDRDIVTKVVTFGDGSWSMYLRPGRYVFMFEKNGYISVSMERVIA